MGLVKVALMDGKGHQHHEGELESTTLEEADLLQHNGRVYGYVGMRQGVFTFQEKHQPWEITGKLKPVSDQVPEPVVPQLDLGTSLAAHGGYALGVKAAMDLCAAKRNETPPGPIFGALNMLLGDLDDLRRAHLKKGGT